MPPRKPQSREEAELLSSFLFLFNNAEERIVEYGFGRFRAGRGPMKMGLLILMDTGLMFFPESEDYNEQVEGGTVAPWPDVAGITVKKKMMGYRITVSTRSSDLLTFRTIFPPTLGSAIESAWKRSQAH